MQRLAFKLRLQTSSLVRGISSLISDRSREASTLSFTPLATVLSLLEVVAKVCGYAQASFGCLRDCHKDIRGVGEATTHLAGLSSRLFAGFLRRSASKFTHRPKISSTGCSHANLGFLALGFGEPETTQGVNAFFPTLKIQYFLILSAFVCFCFRWRRIVTARPSFALARK